MNLVFHKVLHLSGPNDEEYALSPTLVPSSAQVLESGSCCEETNNIVTVTCFLTMQQRIEQGMLVLTSALASHFQAFA